jgi:hypothetical protein
MLFDALALLVMPVLPITKKTRSNYQGAYDRYLAPTLGGKSVVLITSDDVMAAIKDAPPQSAYQALMVGKTLMREAKVTPNWAQFLRSSSIMAWARESL